MATINRANRIVANVLENTRRDFGGVGWFGCGVVDIVLVGRRSVAAHCKKKIGWAHAGIVKDAVDDFPKVDDPPRT
jgi:hypothetical protein